MTPPDLNTMKRAVAELIPDVLGIADSPRKIGFVHWLDTGNELLDSEWLHAVHLAEKTLTKQEYGQYWDKLFSFFGDSIYVPSATVEQRLIAITTVKCPDLFAL